jgi:hypothetical protein
MSVYFLHDWKNEAVKIGIASDVGRRVSALRMATAIDLVLLGSIEGSRETEAELHRQFAHERIRGEWFKATEELMACVWRLVRSNGQPVTIKAELERRNNCRYGLRGVRIQVRDYADQEFIIHSTRWDDRDRLTIRVDDEDGERLYVDAADCFLMSSWPVVCGCWLEQSAEEVS